MQSADYVKTQFYATPHFFTHFNFTGHARGYNKEEDSRKDIEMIACPDALWYRLKILCLNLGINLIENKTGNTENQSCNKKNSVVFYCDIGKNNTKKRYESTGMSNLT